LQEIEKHTMINTKFEKLFAKVKKSGQENIDEYLKNSRLEYKKLKALEQKAKVLPALISI